jgi:thiol-disulfide isomerase/thioredoxin
MKTLFALRSAAFLAFTVGGAVLCGGQLSAQEDTPPAINESKDPKTSMYVVPKTDKPKELVEFLVRLQEFTPNNRKEAEEYDAKAPGAAKRAANRILELVKDPADENYTIARHVLISHDIQELYETEDAKKHAAVAEEVVKFVGGAPKFTQHHVDMVMMMSDVLENTAPAEVGIKYLPQFAEIFEKQKHDELTEQAQAFRGLARRLALPGHVMNLKGKTFDGKDFNLADLKGKVVLVDFWATWCGFCVKEFPHVEELYKAYEGRGFEVVGVSLDEDREQLKDFLKENKLPWIIVHDAENMGDHPAAKEYGIVGLPTVVLIGKDGNVITFDARGEQLDEQLAKLLGPVAPKEKKKVEK